MDKALLIIESISQGLISSSMFYIAFVSANIRGEYKRIEKKYHGKKILKATIPSELKRRYDNLEINKISDEEIKKAVLEFANVLINKFPLEVLTNLYNNLNGLTVKRKRILGDYGRHSTIYNRIRVKEFNSIYHELFHAASSYYDEEKGIIYSGFSQYNLKLKMGIGYGLREGYTGLLTRRYFGGKKLKEADVVEVLIMGNLEKIIGKDKVERLYLTSNLPGLIGELKNYASEDEIMKFITRLDIINSSFYLAKSLLFRECVFDTYEFLLKTNAVKLKKQFEAGQIDISEFERASDEYFSLFDDDIKVAKAHHELRNLRIMYDNILRDIGAPRYAVFQTRR